MKVVQTYNDSFILKLLFLSQFTKYDTQFILSTLTHKVDWIQVLIETISLFVLNLILISLESVHTKSLHTKSVHMKVNSHKSQFSCVEVSSHELKSVHMNWCQFTWIEISSHKISSIMNIKFIVSWCEVVFFSIYCSCILFHIILFKATPSTKLIQSLVRDLQL